MGSRALNGHASGARSSPMGNKCSNVPDSSSTSRVSVALMLKPIFGIHEKSSEIFPTPVRCGRFTCCVRMQHLCCTRLKRPQPSHAAPLCQRMWLTSCKMRLENPVKRSVQLKARLTAGLTGSWARGRFPFLTLSCNVHFRVYWQELGKYFCKTVVPSTPVGAQRNRTLPPEVVAEKLNTAVLIAVLAFCGDPLLYVTWI